jgi:hypothetical protein
LKWDCAGEDGRAAVARATRGRFTAADTVILQARANGGSRRPNDRRRAALVSGDVAGARAAAKKRRRQFKGAGLGCGAAAAPAACGRSSRLLTRRARLPPAQSSSGGSVAANGVLRRCRQRFEHRSRATAGEPLRRARQADSIHDCGPGQPAGACWQRPAAE